ncbi:cellulose biosynthesis cyclic di-GMP-binding regulatory protein BcsB [Mariprofundus ferrooxydans]|uniref:cellulose biosynthesis cyclic di-GMP-binding regulatory protein BcsB n=1 Tax=Mariprofundus ferrooxydans TaxID=314344 RepID=UPI00035C22A0|nr:cellulose biosynthesis cyclic di-GMP-binding regulatory protein BcsB [Mariprofundus ferrooxydans]
MRSYHEMINIVRRVLLPIFLLLFSQVALADIGDRLEVLENNAILYAGPSSTASHLASLNAGEQMVEMERQGGWVFVSLKRSGNQGWILSRQVRKAPAHIIAAATKAKPAAAAKTTGKAASSKRKGKMVVKKVPEPIVTNPDTPFATRNVSLDDLGFRKGIMFEGATVSHATTFFFPAPLDSRITNGALRLLFRASPDLNKFANFRVSINDIPYKQLELPHDSGMHELDLLLPSSAFHGKLVKVTISAILPVSDDRCFDDRLSNVFLHIMPESSLSISYQPLERSIRDAWRLLPHKVTISLSQGALSKDQFASTLAVMALLADKGKEVNLVRLPTVGDIVIAPKSALAGLATDVSGSAPEQTDNLMMAHFANRSAIVVTDPYDVQPMYLLDDNWKILAAGDHYRVYRPDSLRAHGGPMGLEGDAGFYSLPLSTLGMNTDVKYLTREVSWRTMVSPFALPMGTQPDFLNLEVVAPVRWKDDPNYELYVFLNDVLVKSARLAGNGVKQHFTVNLPSEYQKQFNDIRVVIQHDIEEGGCHGVMPSDYVQIMPDSALVVKKESTVSPAKFSDLSRYFLSGFDTYMESSYLDHPEQVLHLMARLASDFPLVIDHSRLHFVSSSEVVNPDGPFVAVGHFPMGESIEAPVRFDKGHVQIQTPKGQTYFDLSNLTKVTVAEIVKAPSAFGMWITPADNAELPVTNRLDLAEDNVAFIDSQGVIKTMNSAEPSLAQVYYPDVEDWFDVLGKYKFWLMVALWFLLTMVVVYLYRMSRSNKIAREADDSFYQSEEEKMRASAAADMGDSLDHLDEHR